MGLEAKCAAKWGKVTATGKLHLDSKKLAFSGDKSKWAIDLGSDIKTKIADGWLTIWRGREKAMFELGEAAEKWEKKILAPPSRLQKLGVKPEMNYLPKGNFPKDFVKEMETSGARQVRKIDKAEMVFLLLETKSDLPKIAQVASLLIGKTPLWIVWPKGQSVLSESAVMEFAANCDLGPSKNCAFDERLTAMKYYKKTP